MDALRGKNVFLFLDQEQVPVRHKEKVIQNPNLRGRLQLSSGLSATKPHMGKKEQQGERLGGKHKDYLTERE